MKRTIFEGAATALITPMKEDRSIHYSVLEAVIEHQIAHHADALLIAGTTGEASTLSNQEHMELIRFTVEHTAHRVPVIAGVGSNSTAHAEELSKMAEQAGVDALLHVTPYYNKTSQEGLVRHFGACAKATGLPVMLYNIPSRTGVNILPETYLRLCEYDNITAVKEASGNFSQIAQTAALCGDRLDIYSGNDDQILPMLALGAKGVLSVLGNLLPQVVHEICASYFRNDAEESRRLQLEYLELMNALFADVNPIPVKQAMNLMGMEVGPCRLPLCEMDSAGQNKLSAVMKKYHLLAGQGQSFCCKLDSFQPAGLDGVQQITGARLVSAGFAVK